MVAFKNLIDAVSQQLGYEIEVVDNMCVLGSDEVKLLVMGTLVKQEEHIVIASQLGQPPPQRLEKLYEAMMQATFFSQDMAFASFTQSPQTGHLWVQRVELLAGMTPELLIDHITTLGETAQSWKKLIEDFRDTSTTQPDAPELPIDPTGNFIHV